MNEQYVDTIHRYLSGMMDSAEREAFETEITGNPALRKDVEVERLLLAGLEQAGDADLQKNIGDVHNRLKTEGFFESSAGSHPSPIQMIHFSKTSVMKRIISIAAIFIVVAAGVWYFLQNKSDVDPGAVFARNYQPQQDVQRARSIIATLESYGRAGAMTDSDSLRQALQLYEAGNFDEALALLKSLQQSHPENDTVQYYLGVIYMSRGLYAKAIEILLPLSESASALKNDALWNLGLCYLKTESGVDEAREAFTKLSQNNDYPDHRSAKAVLEQLIPK